jgi:microcompartment protein CcmK/EutM
MTDSQIRPWVGKSVRAKLADGRTLAGTLHADDAHGHGHVHYVIVSAGASGRQEMIHGADSFVEIVDATTS